jgi:hypothetical protein
MEDDSHAVESRSNEMPVYDVGEAGKDGNVGEGMTYMSCM